MLHRRKDYGTTKLILGFLHPGDPLGHWGMIGPVNSYITGNESSPRAIMYMHEAFGAQLPNSQLLAGEFGTTGELIYRYFCQRTRGSRLHSRFF